MFSRREQVSLLSICLPCGGLDPRSNQRALSGAYVALPLLAREALMVATEVRRCSLEIRDRKNTAIVFRVLLEQSWHIGME